MRIWRTLLPSYVILSDNSSKRSRPNDRWEWRGSLYQLHPLYRYVVFAFQLKLAFFRLRWITLWPRVPHLMSRAHAFISWAFSFHCISTVWPSISTDAPQNGSLFEDSQLGQKSCAKWKRWSCYTLIRSSLYNSSKQYSWGTQRTMDHNGNR